MGRSLDSAAALARRDQITALLAAGGLEACRDLVLDEVATGPAGMAWCEGLTAAVMAADDLPAAAGLADLLARVRRGSTRRPARRSNGRALTPPAPHHGPVSAAKLAHDADQFDLLRRRGLLGPEFDAVIADYRTLAARSTRSGDDPPGPPLAGGAADRLAAVRGRIVHVADAPRVPRALTDGWAAAALEARVLADPAGVAVADDVLTTAAWEGLVRFCQESTVWSDDTHGSGRLGAAFENGFTCALLVQLAGEVRERFPRWIGDRPLLGIEATKHPAVSAADPHPQATAPAVEVRFWITPTAANLEPDAGGLVVDGRPPDPPTVVPYRGNRAVLLAPGRPHRTDAVRFAAGYEHRRIEIALRWAAPPD